MTAAWTPETMAKAKDAEARGEGICRTCLAPIWNEGGTIDHRRREEGWSDRIERGGDSLVCFKAIDYRHVPLTGREAAIYDGATKRAVLRLLRSCWPGTAKSSGGFVGAALSTSRGANWARRTRAVRMTARWSLVVSVLGR